MLCHRLTSDVLTDTSSSTTASHTYGFDDDSNFTSQTITLPGNSSAGQHTYHYDRSGRITNWTRPDSSFTDYAWDGAGNRTQAGASTFTYDERNRLISGPEGTYTWTARGTLSQVGSTTFSFDALGRLVDYNGAAAWIRD